VLLGNVVKGQHVGTCVAPQRRCVLGSRSSW
jgi:hypothetical protein